MGRSPNLHLNICDLDSRENCGKRRLLLLSAVAVAVISAVVPGGSSDSRESRIMRRFKTGMRWLVFAVAAFVLNFPVLATLITSLKTNAEMFSK